MFKVGGFYKFPNVITLGRDKAFSQTEVWTNWNTRQNFDGHPLDVIEHFMLYKVVSLKIKKYDVFFNTRQFYLVIKCSPPGNWALHTVQSI